LKYKALLNMRNNSYKQLWLTIKIWLIAIAVNTVSGTVFLAGFISHYESAWGYIKLGIVWGAIFSLPIALILRYTLRHCINCNMNGWALIRYMLLVGIGFTVFMFFIFWAVISIGAHSILLVLLGIAVLSGIVAILSQYRSLLKCGSDYDEPITANLEN
jgi:hypothetical protein